MFTMFSCLTDHLQVSFLAGHGLRVDLAHVPTSVGLLHITDVQEPRTMVVVSQCYPGVFRHHPVVYRKYGLGANTNPSDL